MSMSVTPLSNPNDEPSEPSIPDWLDKLQKESWQAEILISGGAFVALASATVTLVPLFQFLFYGTLIPEQLIGRVSFGIDAVVPTLMFGFLAHLVLRGFWIGLVGMNYVFPKGIDKDRLAMKGKFSTMFREAGNISLIVRLDQYCSAIFAISFVWFFSCIGVLIFASLFVLASDKFDSNLISLSIIAISLVTLADFLSAGRIKTVKWFAVIYYPVHKVVSLITLSFIYRRLYYTIVSNIPVRYAILIFSVPFFLILCFTQLSNTSSDLSGSFEDRHGGYKNSNNPSFLTIKDRVIYEDFMEVELIQITRLEDDAFVDWKNKNPKNSEKSFKELNSKVQRLLLSQLYQISIDGKDVDCDWLITRPRQTAGPLFPRSLLVTVLNIADLPSGPHELTVTIKLNHEVLLGQKSAGGGAYARVGFYFQKPMEEKRL